MKQIVRTKDQKSLSSQYFILRCEKCKSEEALKAIESSGLYVIRCENCKIILHSSKPSIKEAVAAWNDAITKNQNQSDVIDRENQATEWIAYTPSGAHIKEVRAETEDDCWWQLRQEYGSLYKSVEEMRKRGFKVAEVPF